MKTEFKTVACDKRDEFEAVCSELLSADWVLIKVEAVVCPDAQDHKNTDILLFAYFTRV
jgi:hypothetical protein